MIGLVSMAANERAGGGETVSPNEGFHKVEATECGRERRWYANLLRRWAGAGNGGEGEGCKSEVAMAEQRRTAALIMDGVGAGAGWDTGLAGIRVAWAWCAERVGAGWCWVEDARLRLLGLPSILEGAKHGRALGLLRSAFRSSI
jgi:hypothetical protein